MTTPLPLVELAARVGALHAHNPVDYEEVGKKMRAEIVRALIEGWTFAGKRVLDFGCGAGRTLRHFLEEARRGARLRRRRAQHRMAAGESVPVVEGLPVARGPTPCPSKTARS